MSRTTRRAPGWLHGKTPLWGEDPEWHAGLQLQYIRGAILGSYAHGCPTKEGGFRFYEADNHPNGKRYYKRLVRRMSRREAKVKLRHW